MRYKVEVVEIRKRTLEIECTGEELKDRLDELEVEACEESAFFAEVGCEGSVKAIATLLPE